MAASPRASRMRNAISIWNDEKEENTQVPARDRRSFESDTLTDVGIADSIETPDFEVDADAFDGKDYGERHFSSTTAIRLDDQIESTDDERDEREQYPEVQVRYHYEDDPFSEDGAQSDHDVGSRKISGAPTMSTMPEDYHIQSPETHRSPLSSRQNTNNTPLQPLKQSRLLSSPTRSGRSARQFSPATPASTRDRYASSPLARNNSGFRNPSSVRAMQMSSPSPPPGMSPRFAQSPRSARQRHIEVSQSQRSESGTPNKHSNPNKEYPLILLHCSFTPTLLDYPTTVLNTVLPPWIKHNLSLLKEKVNHAVVDRGILIPHPGEDFELLEERMLESLELKRPRVGKCGHFVGVHGDVHKNTGNAEQHVHEGRDFEHAPPVCDVCARQVEDDHRGCEGETPLQRFDLRIYAANGLMRAGAWSAAWREMEKVDVEVGVWLPDDVRLSLDQETIRHEQQWETHGLDRVRELRVEMPFAPTPPPAVPSRQPSSHVRGFEGELHDEPPMTAIYAMPKASRPTNSSDRGADSRSRSSATQRRRDEVSLSTLLARFIHRKLGLSRELFLQVLIVVLAVVLLKQWWTPVLTPLAAQTMETLPEHIPKAFAPDAISTVAVSTTTTITATATVLGSSFTAESIPICTFSPEHASEHGMTAVPKYLARSMLDAASTPLVTPSTSYIDGKTETAAGINDAHDVDSTAVADTNEPVGSPAQEFPEIAPMDRLAGGELPVDD